MFNIPSWYLSMISSISTHAANFINRFQGGSCLNLLSIPGPGMTEIDKRKSLSV